MQVGGVVIGLEPARQVGGHAGALVILVKEAGQADLVVWVGLVAQVEVEDVGPQVTVDDIELLFHHPPGPGVEDPSRLGIPPKVVAGVAVVVAQGVVHALLLPADPGPGLPEAVAAQRAVGVDPRAGALAPLGDDVDDPAHGIGAVKRRVWPLDHLDALDDIHGNGVDGDEAGDGVVDGHAVQEHQVLAGAAHAPDVGEDRNLMADAVRPLDLYPRQIVQGVVPGGQGEPLQVLGLDHLHPGHHLVHVPLGPGAGDHHLLHLGLGGLLWFAFPRPRRAGP